MDEENHYSPYGKELDEVLRRLGQLNQVGRWDETLIRLFAKVASSCLYLQLLCGSDRMEETRRAALDAIQALDWLATPAERIEIIIRRPPYRSPQERESEAKD